VQTGVLIASGDITTAGVFRGNVVGSLTGGLTGNITGNAATVTDGMYLSTVQTVTGDKTFNSRIVMNGGLTAGQATITNLSVQNFSMQQGTIGNAVISFETLTDNNHTTTINSFNTSGEWTDIGSTNSILPTQHAVKVYVDAGVARAIAAIPPPPTAHLQNIVQSIVGTIDLVMATSAVGDAAGGGFSAQGWSGWTNQVSGPAITGGQVNSLQAGAYFYGAGGGGPQISLTIDLGTVMGLSSNPNSLTWRGNYDFNIAPSLTRIADRRSTYYGMGQGNWYVYCAPNSQNNTDANWGTFTITVGVTDYGHPYHGTNIQAAWLGIASRGRNYHGL
jgi:hypothetical protein